MALLIPPGFAQCVIEQYRSGDTEPMLNTFGIAITTAPSTGVAGIANDVMAAWTASIGTGYSSVTSVRGVTVYVGQDGPDPMVYTSSLPPFVGPNSNNLVPQNSAILVRKRTDAAGRRGRGRLYIPEVSESDVDNVGNLSSTYRSAWQTRATALLANLSDSAFDGVLPMVVLHRSEGAGVEPAPTPVTALVVETRIATQRRRLRP